MFPDESRFHRVHVPIISSFQIVRKVIVNIAAWRRIVGWGQRRRPIFREPLAGRSGKSVPVPLAGPGGASGASPRDGLGGAPSPELPAITGTSANR